MTETEYLMQGANGKRLMESIGQLSTMRTAKANGVPYSFAVEALEAKSDDVKPYVRRSERPNNDEWAPPNYLPLVGAIQLAHLL
jgi:hypothetical protein